jgi:hypothetical protein
MRETGTHLGALGRSQVNSLNEMPPRGKEDMPSSQGRNVEKRNDSGC